MKNSRFSKFTWIFVFLFSLSPPLYAQNTIVDLQKSGTPFIEVPVLNGTTVEIEPSTGNLVIQTTQNFECSSGCEDVRVSMADGDGFLLVNGDSPAEVVEGSTVTFQWASRGAWECEGSGLAGTSWPGTGKLPNGSQTGVSLDAFAAETVQTATLTCTNGSISDSRNVQISITSGDLSIPTECRGRQPAGMIARKFCVFGSTTDCFDYSNVFGPFPGTSTSREIITERDEYLTMELNSGNLIDKTSGAWTFQALPLSVLGDQGPRILSLSKCPGDFDAVKISNDMNSGNCYVKTGGLTNTVSWERADLDTGRCPLQPNTTYYLNILYTNSPGGTQPSELIWECGNNPDEDTCGNLVAPR